MSYLSKHYFCICNCRLNAFMSVCNTSMPLQMKLLRFVVNSVLLKCRKLRREDQETSDWIVSRIFLYSNDMSCYL